MKDRSAILAAKAALPLPALLQTLGIAAPSCGGNIKSPLRGGSNQKTDSFSIYRHNDSGGWFWKDRSGGDDIGGDEVTLLEHLENLPKKDAIARYLSLAGVPNPLSGAMGSRSPKSNSSESVPSWDSLSASFNIEEQKKLADARGYSVELVSWLHQKGFLGLYNGSPCLPVRNDEGSLLAVHVRPPSGKWFYTPKGIGTHPMILGELKDAEYTYVFESQWDLFAAMDALRLYDHFNPKIAFLCTRGASNGRLAKIANGTVYAFPQNDPEKHGKRAGEEWLKSVALSVPGEVYRVNTPSQHSDLNDWLRTGNIESALKAAIDDVVLVPRSEPSPVSKLHAELTLVDGEKPPFDPLAICEKIGLWWLDGSGAYFLQDGEGKALRYLEMGSAEVRRHLKSLCLKSAPSSESAEPIDRSMSEIDRVLHSTNLHRSVDAAASVAGNRAGVYQKQGGRLLVRTSPRLIEAQEGSCVQIEKFICKLLGLKGSLHFCYWLKVAYEALIAGDILPGQCLIICGPPGCGKSFLQHQIITPILASRAADPKSYFFGRTDFNSEIVGAEHLLIEEVPSSNHHEDRNNFGEKIKEVVANDLMRLHKKNRDAISVQPFHRISITINDHPEKMKVLPPLTGDFTEKIIMLQAGDARDFFKAFDSFPNPRRAVQEAIDSELPAFCHWLLNLDIPDEMKSRRYGVISHVPDELAAILFDQEPESQLLLLIDKELFAQGSPNHGQEWSGDAEDLQQFLTAEERPSRKSAIKLLNYSSACGQLLGKLRSKYPNRFRQHRTSTRRLWMIAPPESSVQA